MTVLYLILRDLIRVTWWVTVKLIEFVVWVLLWLTAALIEGIKRYMERKEAQQHGPQQAQDHEAPHTPWYSDRR